MLSRQISKTLTRAASTVNVTMASHGVALLQLANPPVNTLNPTLLADIKTTVDDVVKDKASAIVISSQRPGVFSSGLDIFSMYGKSDDELRAFWEKGSDKNIFLKLIHHTRPKFFCLINIENCSLCLDDCIQCIL